MCIFSVVKAVLNWCKIVAANICRGKKKKGFYSNSAKSRNKMSKGKLEWKATFKKTGLLYGCTAVALVLHLSCVSHMEWSPAILYLNIHDFQGILVEWKNNFCCKKCSLLDIDISFRYNNCMSFIYLPKIMAYKHQLFPLFMECFHVTQMS